MPLSSRYDSGSLKLASHLLQSLDEPHFDDPAVQNMDMHQRSELWSQVRYKKIESIKNNSKGKGLEECTFKPKLNNKASTKSLKTSNSLKKLQTINSIQKYVFRMNKVREQKDINQIKADKKVGSGKNWTRRITVPIEPTLSYKRGRSKVVRRNASTERNISKELFKRNVSLEQIQTKDYIKDDDFVINYHNHYSKEVEHGQNVFHLTR